MRVLWFTNTPSNYQRGDVRGHNGGGWIVSAEEEMKQVPEIELAVSFVLDGQPERVVQGGVVYYPIKKIGSRFTNIFNPKKLWVEQITAMKKVIEDFNPDIIQIFGSEEYFGLIANQIDIPVVLHIQGILNPYLNAFFIPGVSVKDYICQNFNPKKLISNILGLKNFRKGSQREVEIMRRVKYFIGRTDWDFRCTKVMNPNSKYFYGSEILRKVFYDNSIRNIPLRKVIITTTISQPLYKGFDLVLKTANLLKENLDFEFSWRVFGNINPKVAERIANTKCKDVNVELCGVATSEQLHQELLNSTIYVHTSYIDNSPNSVCEAQLMGLPVIVTHVGGTYSLIEEGVTGFSVPANDPYQMAYFINKLRDKDLNTQIGANARKIALKRHDKKNIISELIKTYMSVIADYTNNK